MELINELEQENQSVAVVITDWMMPGLKGDQLLEEVHRINPDIKAIMVTGQAEDEIINKVRNMPNVLTVIKKPWRQNQLQEALSGIHFSE